MKQYHTEQLTILRASHDRAQLEEQKTFDAGEHDASYNWFSISQGLSTAVYFHEVALERLNADDS